LIRPSTVLWGLAFGASNVHQAGQLVQMGGENWEWSGGATYYRAPGTPAPQGPRGWRVEGAPTVSTAPDSNRLREAASLLRTAATQIDGSIESGATADANLAQRKIREALTLLHPKNKGR
jgi:hypothetical protein